SSVLLNTPPPLPSSLFPYTTLFRSPGHFKSTQKAVKIAPRAPSNEIMNTQLKKKMADIGAKTKVCFRVVFADGSSWQNHERPPRSEERRVGEEGRKAGGQCAPANCK